MAFGLISATWGVGLATGPLVNLIPFKGYTIPMIVSMCSSSCCFIYTCIVIPESLEDKYKVPFTCGSINSAKNLSVLWYGPLNYRTAARTLFLRPYLAHFCPVFSRFFAVFSVLTPGFQKVAPQDRGPAP